MAAYHVLMLERRNNQVLELSKQTGSRQNLFKTAEAHYRFKPGGGRWGGINDAKYRQFGNKKHLLIACQGGGVGLFPVDYRFNGRTPGQTPSSIPTTYDTYFNAGAAGTPHGVELIPAHGNLGVVIAVACPKQVIASGTGVIQFWMRNDAGNWAKVHQRQMPSAHALLWDSQNNRLWAGGDSCLQSFEITKVGNGLSSTKEADFDSSPGNGNIKAVVHDIQPDYRDSKFLLFVDGCGARRVAYGGNAPGGGHPAFENEAVYWRSEMEGEYPNNRPDDDRRNFKSFCRIAGASGETFWILSAGAYHEKPPGKKPYEGRTSFECYDLQFGPPTGGQVGTKHHPTSRKTLSFYKARTIKTSYI
ncbi:MAG: hypothetical protein EOO70_04820 [Myxococcaceae bacterium]|nr:MAG: hypothetical protein EOO70_04820 [Myxococcaceae bacterium]